MDDSFKLKFHLLDGKGKPCGVFDDAILRYIKENYNLFFIAGTPYHYTDGVYEVIHGSKALFGVDLIWSSRGDGKIYKARFFGRSQVHTVTE